MIRWLGACPLYLLCCCALAGEMDCNVLRERASTAASSSELITAFDAARHCGNALTDALGRRVARALMQDTQNALRAGNVEDAERQARRSLSYAPSWQASATLGDIATRQADHDKAARYYQECLDLIADATLTPHAPSASVIAALFAKAEQAGLLARDYVRTVNRSTGSPGGVTLSNIRGFVPEAVALPITFEFDSTTFTDKGRAAAADLLALLTREKLAAVDLIGHTDPRGTDAYNLDLSRRRASALRDFLLQGGYRGRIDAQGVGESRPPVIDDPDAYTEEERFQLHRRVEMRRGESTE